MTLAGPVHDAAAVPFDAPEIRVRRHRPTVRVWSPEIARAALRVRWQIDLARATALYARLGRIDETAAAMGSRRERVSALLEEAGVRTPRRRCSAAPRGAR